MADKSAISWTATFNADGTVTPGATWNPLLGCDKVSEGCRFCYAIRSAWVKQHNPNPKIRAAYEGLVAQRDDGSLNWTGKINLIPERLEIPLHWKQPRRIFVNSLSDLFHEDVPDAFIDQVFAVMALARRHTFQILTKRPERMAAYVNDESTPHRVAREIDQIEVQEAIRALPESWRDVPSFPGYQVSNHGRVRGPRSELSPDVGEHGHSRVTLYRNGSPQKILVHRLVLSVFGREPIDGEQGRHRNGDPTCNALPNLLWGSQSDNWEDRKRHGNHRSYHKLSQAETADIRTRMANGGVAEHLGPELGVSPTQIRNIAAGKQWCTEPGVPWPLPGVWLGTSTEDQKTADERIPHLLRTPASVRFLSCEPLLGPLDLEPYIPIHNAADGFKNAGSYSRAQQIQWCIAGGESGLKARAMHPDWARSLRDQCQAAGVPFFWKQWGEWAPAERDQATHLMHVSGTFGPRADFTQDFPYGQSSGRDQDLVDRGHPGWVRLRRVGNKAAGDLLDGKSWHQFPVVHTAVPA